MTKSEALSHFGDDNVAPAARIAAMADFLGVSRTAIYMWPDEAIPPRRELQIENGKLAGRLPLRVDQERPAA